MSSLTDCPLRGGCRHTAASHVSRSPSCQRTTRPASPLADISYYTSSARKVKAILGPIRLPWRFSAAFFSTAREDGHRRVRRARGGGGRRRFTTKTRRARRGGRGEGEKGEEGVSGHVSCGHTTRPALLRRFAGRRKPVTRDAMPSWPLRPTRPIRRIYPICPMRCPQEDLTQRQRSAAEREAGQSPISQEVLTQSRQDAKQQRREEQKTGYTVSNCARIADR